MMEVLGNNTLLISDELDQIVAEELAGCCDHWMPSAKETLKKNGISLYQDIHKGYRVVFLDEESMTKFIMKFS